MAAKEILFDSKAREKLKRGVDKLANAVKVTLLDVHLLVLAIVGDLARTHGDDLAFHGLFLGRVGDDDAALGDFFLFQTLNQHAIA